MHLGSFCLFFVVSLSRLSSNVAENEWSGFVNSIKEDISYLCHSSLAIVGVASEFNDPQNDRRWEYQCSSGGGVANVSSNCTFQDSINEHQKEFNFECPDEGYIAGFISNFSDIHDDRLWRPYCCTRPYSSLVDCDIPSSQWENNVESPLNWTTTNSRILTGLQSFYSPFNRDRRWRFKQCTLQVTCGDPGVPENAIRVGESFLYQDEVTYTCNHGYYQSSGAVGGLRQCLDTGLWSDTQPVCSLCTSIDNCADIRCTNPTDQYCAMCESDHGFGLGEKGFANLNTSCEPLCSWLGNFCYPGDCPGDYTTCNCTEGFTGADCLEIVEDSNINSCEIEITLPDSAESKCEINGTQPVYLNFKPVEVKVEFDVNFVLHSSPPKPAYVQNYQIGIAEANIATAVYRMNSYPDTSATSTSSPCSTNEPSPDSPSPILMCQHTESDLSMHNFLHGDWFEVGVSITNGGYLNVTNLDSNETKSHYYTGTNIFPNAVFVIDLHPPTHCSIDKSITCLSDQVLLSESLVYNNRIMLEWGGWFDTPSDITTYRVEIYELKYDSDSGVLDKSNTLVFGETYDSNEGTPVYSETSSALPNEGPFSIIFIITDGAGNMQYARRIIVYDDDSDLEEDTSIPLIVSSGVAENSINAFWQNSTTGPIIVSGEGHFYNQNLKTDNWLAPVVPNSPSVPTEFDDDDRFGVNNSLGITTLSYQYIVDQEAGQSVQALTQPASFPYQTDDLALEAVKVDVSPEELNDGDSVTVWFEARDFKNSDPAYESVLVHIDSSPPVVTNLGLELDGVDHLISLYGSAKLVNLDVTFETSDIHSGLYAIHWIIQTDQSFIGEGEVSPKDLEKDECLLSSDCVCDIVDHCFTTKYSVTFLSTDFVSQLSEGVHDTDYYFTVEVTNYAQLQSSLTKKFTVDLTKPSIGVVFETANKTVAQDIDYQTTLLLNVQWKGFFDPETSIIAYQYIIDKACSLASAFDYPNIGNSKAIVTNDTSVSLNLSNPGVYYTTVVAYNGAYLASDPVCSDGVTIDTVPPKFEWLNIPESKVREGLVINNGDVWVIHRNRERSLIQNGEPSCVEKSLNITFEELAAFSVRYTSSGNISKIAAEDCHNFMMYDPHTYLPIDTMLNISWYATDEIGIRDYHFGISTSIENSKTSPDIIEFTSTAGFSHFSTHHSLFTSANEFYVSVKAIDLSMQETTVIAGPVIIDTLPPELNGSMVTNLVDDLVIITWEEWTIVDEEDIFPLVYKYSIGRTKFSDDVQSFTSLTNPVNSECLSDQCIVINTTEMNFLQGNDYHVTVSAENTAGLFLYIPIDPITTPFILESNCLSVFEYLSITDVPNQRSSCYLSEEYDFDIFPNYSNISVSWYGLTQEHLNSSFSVAVGSEPGLSDVLSFMAAGNLSSVELPEVMFEYGKTYYSTVKAENSHSTVYQSSDGFQVIPNSSEGAGVWIGLSDYSNAEYVLSETEISAQWYFPSAMSSFVSHYEWACYESSDINLTNITLNLEYDNVGRKDWGIRSAKLDALKYYAVSVKACFKQFCLEPVYSKAFAVSSAPNTSVSSLEAFYIPKIIDEYGYSSKGELHIRWSSFSCNNCMYEWAIGTSQQNRELLKDWSSADSTIVNTTFNHQINLHKTYYVTIRGVNGAGLDSYLTGILVFSGDYTIEPLVVYDVYSEYVPDHTKQIEFVYTQYTDLDYTSSNSELSAVWPDLRYSTYNYSIATVKEFQSCSSNPLACGATQYNGISISNLNLTHGEIYFFCIKAYLEDEFTPYPSQPKTITSCSNGIMAYFTSPTGACVQMKPLYEKNNLPKLTYHKLTENSASDKIRNEDCAFISGSQSSTNFVHIVWKEFTDEVQNAPHDSRVSFYEYAIGSSYGAENIVQFTDVGAVTSVYVTGLSLQHGITYYATVRANDLAGGQSILTSQGLTIDQTVPIFSDIWLNTQFTVYFNSLNDLTPQWDQISDKESGISTLYWSFGSEVGLSDLHKWTTVNVTAFTAKPDVSFVVPDGQPIYLNILAINNAGLHSIGSSSLVVYDSSSPCSGRVFDGPKLYHAFVDLDYTSEHSSISAHWEPFSDPHTSILEYKWAVGTCIGCDDVGPFISSGLLTDVQRRISLQNGYTYYISVTGCSQYSKCVTISSDSITIDVTGPVTQQLYHGFAQFPLENFQASRNTISAYWFDIHDTESSVSHYIYYIGNEPGGNSLVSETFLPPSAQQIFQSTPFNDVDELPLSDMVYITLEVYNRVGLSNRIISSGVIVSSEPPVSSSNPFIDYAWSGSVINNTQYVKSTIKVNWNFTDTYLIVDRYYWMLMYEESTYQLTQSQRSYQGTHDTLLELNLSDGSSIAAIVIACNQAGVCIQRKAQAIIIDSSPPVGGYFAIKSNSAASLPWAIEKGMSVERDALNLTFTGFIDPESSIGQYWAIVGSTFMGNDLFNSNSSLEVYDGFFDIKSSQIVLNRNISDGEIIYISIWAVNGVGMRSSIITGAFKVVISQNTSGFLELLRSQLCPIESCVGHCTCGERGHMCESTNACVETNSTDLIAGQKITVTNFVPQVGDTIFDSPLFTSVSDKLIAVVQLDAESPSYYFVEWSVGEKGKDFGFGLMDISSDTVWFPYVSQDAMLIFSISDLYPLTLGKTYVFYVRMWHNSSHYSVFESSGVVFDNQSPLVNKGYRVKEVLSPSVEDIDFIGSSSTLQVNWFNVYNKRYATLYANFELCIGLSPGAGGVFCTDVDGTNISLNGLSLKDNTKYYTVLEATTSLGVVFFSLSDGFLVDLTQPDFGVVFDGQYLTDEAGHVSPSFTIGRVLGFNDPQSGIAKFIAGTEKQNLYYENGIARVIKLEHAEVSQGNITHLSVAALNSGGIASKVMTSTGSVVDSTPPYLYDCDTINAALTGSFDVYSNDDVCVCSTSNWLISDVYTLYHIEQLWENISTIPIDSCCAIQLGPGSRLSQSINTINGRLYILSFWIFIESKKSTTILVECKGTNSLLIYRKISLKPILDCGERFQWQKVEVVFEPESDVTVVSITASPYQSLVIDDIKASYCEDSSSNELSSFTLNHYTRPNTVVWPISDFESGIREFLFSIGTVKGGIQIKDYQSVGPMNWGFHDLWDIKHGSEIYFTIKATNYAGLSSVYYSEPITIDTTIPTASNGAVVEVLEIGGSDLDYINSDHVILDWSSISDKESGIKHCVWALGSSSGLSNIKNFSLTEEMSVNLTSLSDITSHGSTIYTIVICLSNAGLVVSAESDGVMLLTIPPKHELAEVIIYNPTPTECAATDGYVSADSIQIVWDGFVDDSFVPLYYEMKIVEHNQLPESAEWNSVDSLKQITLNNLTNLEWNVEHTVMIRSYTIKGLYSEPSSGKFHLIQSPPIVDDSIELNVTQQNELLYIEWKNLFSTVGPISFEVSIGEQVGGGSIRKLIPTTNSFIQVNELEIRQSATYFVSLRAINSAGLSSLVNYMIDNGIIVKL